MVTLGFFTFGGARWSPHTDLPTIIPDMDFFRTGNMEAPACHACLRTELRCPAIANPAQQQSCETLATSLTSAETSSCEVRSFVGAGGAPTGAPLRSLLAACSSVCTPTDVVGFPDYGRGFERPFLHSVSY